MPERLDQMSKRTHILLQSRHATQERSTTSMTSNSKRPCTWRRANLEQLDDSLLLSRLVVADRPAAQLHAIEDEVEMLSAHLTPHG